MHLHQPHRGSNLTWHSFLLRYVAAIAALNLFWEFAQLPFYTLWRNGSVNDLVFAPLHCTLGDVFIGSLALLAAVLILGNSQWPLERYRCVAAGAVLIGLIYTCYSEWVNVYIRKSWAYSDLMPLIPTLKIGLIPFSQWLIIPCTVLAYLRSD